MRGKFITFEGVDGAGKTVQLNLLAEYLRAQGKEVIITKEPGGTDVGNAIRRILLEGDKDKLDAVAETLLFYASRRINIMQVIRPALAAGKYVLCDRFNDSTLAYQYYGYAKFPNTEKLDILYNIVAEELVPDCTFLFDMDVQKGLARSFKKADTMTNKETRFESFTVDFHERIRKGFKELAAKEPQRFITINADDTIENVHQAVVQQFKQRFKA